jgi:hypothetical protein
MKKKKIIQRKKKNCRIKKKQIQNFPNLFFLIKEATKFVEKTNTARE